MELRRVRAGDLEPHPKNWRVHPQGQRRALRGVLRQVGHADALIARELGDGRLELIDGHLRRDLDPDQRLPVLVVDLSAEEAELVLATLDPLAALAEPDPGALEDLLRSVRADSPAVQALLEGLAKAAGLAARSLGDPEDIPPLPEVPRTEVGDLWVLGEHRLACADATDPGVLARAAGGLEPACLWTDPPYGVAYVGKTPSRLTLANDHPGGLRELLQGAFAATDAVLAPGAALYVSHPAGPLSVVFGACFVGAGWRLRQTLVWVKDSLVLGRSDYHYRHEPILYGYKPVGGRRGRGHRGWYGGNDQDSVLQVPRPGASREHPTAKPVELVARCLGNSSTEGDVVLDPFLGSGSTLIACEQLGRRCVGVEVDPAYCDVVVARWKAYTGGRARRERGDRRVA